MTEIITDKLCFLTLGDGDFSYSVDLARHLSEQQTGVSSHLIATGIDSLSELVEKYRNAPDLLQKLEKLSKKKQLTISIHHGINALENTLQMQAHHVIFNHPHLGTEDAKKHARFLSHLFHVASTSWMHADGGVLHLALCKGQFERWHVEECSKRHGLVLLERHDFMPPPCTSPQYQHRRHQTGKSFVSVTKSETCTFGRTKDKGRYVATRLLWQGDKNEESFVGFACPYCEKKFREERSLRNHVNSLHADGETKKRKRQVECQRCKSVGIQRTFAHEQGLEDHIKAKHTGVHSIIRPEWASKADSNHDNTAEGGQYESDSVEALDTVKKKNGDSSALSFGSCSICGLVYRNKEDESLHLQEFIPVESHYGSITPAPSASDKKPFGCSYCSKRFREKRAQLQHENFCSNRSGKSSA